MGEAAGAKTLHAPSFVIDADQEVAAHRLDLGAKRRKLSAIFPVAREQDHAAAQRVAEAAAVRGCERRAGNVEDEGRVIGHEAAFFSTTTKLAA